MARYDGDIRDIWWRNDFFYNIRPLSANRMCKYYVIAVGYTSHWSTVLGHSKTLTEFYQLT